MSPLVNRAQPCKSFCYQTALAVPERLVSYVRDFAKGILKLGVSRCAVCAFGKVLHPYVCGHVQILPDGAVLQLEKQRGCTMDSVDSGRRVPVCQPLTHHVHGILVS